METSQAMGSKPLPQYQSHKKVGGLKIREVVYYRSEPGAETDGSGVLSFIEEGYGKRKVSVEYMRKHKPKAEGYFVVYEGGYESWSPADVFEEGNTLIK